MHLEVSFFLEFSVFTSLPFSQGRITQTASTSITSRQPRRPRAALTRRCTRHRVAAQAISPQDQRARPVRRVATHYRKEAHTPQILPPYKAVILVLRHRSPYLHLSRRSQRLQRLTTTQIFPKSGQNL